ncbi:putative hydrolase [Pseudomonas aeruginosa]|nr:putative hydrolase [Pseudomonas aeruginosa]
MSLELLSNRLEFLREAERLKNVLRSAHTSSGRPESTAEHSWRLCLMALAFEDQLAGLDLGKVLRMCVVHDLGEAIHGDIPAVEQAAHPDKGEQERADLLQLTRHLDAPLRERLLALWDEYERGESAEALAVEGPGQAGNPAPAHPGRQSGGLRLCLQPRLRPSLYRPRTAVQDPARATRRQDPDSASQLGATPSVRPPGQRYQRHRLRSSPWLQGSGWHVSTDRGLSCTPQ